jgi:hypothetical protein
MASETEGRRSKERDAATSEAAKSEPYVPPAVEDIDTTHEPAEAAAGPGVSPGTLGAEESMRWH